MDQNPDANGAGVPDNTIDIKDNGITDYLAVNNPTTGDYLVHIFNVVTWNNEAD
jgi:hypothetical protein